jgi:glucose/arabinose dehydrogenase
MDALYCPSGIALYSGELFPRWQGDILIGALVNKRCAGYVYLTMAAKPAM